MIWRDTVHHDRGADFAPCRDKRSPNQRIDGQRGFVVSTGRFGGQCSRSVGRRMPITEVDLMCKVAATAPVRNALGCLMSSGVCGSPSVLRRDGTFIVESLKCDLENSYRISNEALGEYTLVAALGLNAVGTAPRTDAPARHANPLMLFFCLNCILMTSTHTEAVHLVDQPPVQAAYGKRNGLPRRLQNILSLSDFEAAARHQLPRPIFGYIAGAAEDNISLNANRQCFDQYRFQTRVMVDVSHRNQKVELFGQSWDSPFGIAPVGISALYTYRGDLALARAAAGSHIPAIMSGTSLIPMEEVARAAPGTWFQVYMPGDASRLDGLIDRVRAAGFTTLVVTVDIPVWANRENNVRTGFSMPLRPSLRLAWDGLVRPRWLAGTFLRTLALHGMPHFENSFAERGAPILSSSAIRDTTGRDHLNWQHIEQIRKRWPGKLIIKGILNADDAAIAASIGADGIIVSNHGGRQLDGAASPLTVLPRIVDQVGHRTVVMMDSGIRRGSDVLKAVALGARMVFLGRPFMYAAAVGGAEGVSHAITLLREEVDRNMAMLGAREIAEITSQCLLPATSAFPIHR